MTKKVVVMLSELLENRGMSLNELSLKTGVRRAALSELASNKKRERIQFEHIEKIAEEFNISDIREIITLVNVLEDENEK